MTINVVRADGRRADQLRGVEIIRDFTEFPGGSVLVSMGRTRVFCTASVSDETPRWMKNTGKGWVTAEYSLLPGSSAERVYREAARGHQSGRTYEIQRLIGRSLRAICDMQLLGERQVILDCDVIQADGGTRTASITGAYVALHDALTRLVSTGVLTRHPITDSLAAVSVGVVDGNCLLDLDYSEDARADVDMNIVMVGAGSFVEIQGTGERKAFSRSELDELLRLGEDGIRELLEKQSSVLSTPPAARPA